MLTLQQPYNIYNDALGAIDDITSYARGIVYKDNDRSPVKVTVQLIDSTTGQPTSSPQIVEAGHQFLIWSTNAFYRNVQIRSDGLETITMPFEQLASTYPEPLEIYLKGGTTQNKALFIAAGAGVLFMLSGKRSRKVGKIDPYKYYQGLPPIARGIIAVGGSYLIYRLLDKVLKKPPPSAGEPNAAQNELAQLAAQGIVPTYTPTQFESFCQALINAAWGWGTDEDAIYGVFEAMNNKADVLSLIVKFGIRKWDDPAIPFQFLEGTVSTLISAELDSSEKSNVNDILQSKGIDFRFA